MSRRDSRRPQGAAADREQLNVSIRALDSAARGIADAPGGLLLVEGALPGERVRVRVEVARSRYRIASICELLEASAQRTEPRCGHYAECGGCSLQHLQQAARETWGEQVLTDALQRIGKVEPRRWLQPIRVDAWHYRRRARVRVVKAAGSWRVGFLPRRDRLPFAARECPVLVPELESLLHLLPDLLHEASAGPLIDEIDMVGTAEGVHLLFRTRSRLSAGATEALTRACRKFALTGWLLQSGETEAAALVPGSDPPVYVLENGIRLAFPVEGFVQGNAAVNSRLVATVVELIDLQPEQSVLDLFCGVGNFGIPLAARGARVTGIEVDRSAIRFAERNARDNGVAERTTWLCRDLFNDPAAVNRIACAHAWLIDPPRDGARQLLEAAHARVLPARICYISCNPSTLARDAALLQSRGYQLTAAGCVDMFPQTAHLEALALFEKRQPGGA